MRVLILTQKIDRNDEILGFFLVWIEKLAQKLDSIQILTLYHRPSTLPDNVSVFSLGKERNGNKIIWFLRYLKLTPFLVRNNDVILVHMIPLYTILIAPWAIIFHKPIIFWYAHGKTSLYLRLAKILAEKIVTSSERGFRLKTKKIKIIGQGIDTGFFRPIKRMRSHNFWEILTLGRISPSKNLGTIIEAVNILNKKYQKNQILLKIVGSPPQIDSHQKYYQQIKRMVNQLRLTHLVKFIPGIPYQQTIEYYQNCDLFINASTTGSLDKTVLEAMACGKIILTCNQAYKGILSDQFIFSPLDSIDLAQKINQIFEMPPERIKEKGGILRNIVVKNHSLDGFIERLTNILRQSLS